MEEAIKSDVHSPGYLPPSSAKESGEIQRKKQYRRIQTDEQILAMLPKNKSSQNASRLERCKLDCKRVAAAACNGYCTEHIVQLYRDGLIDITAQGAIESHSQTVPVDCSSVKPTLPVSYSNSPHAGEKSLCDSVRKPSIFSSCGTDRQRFSPQTFEFERKQFPNDLDANSRCLCESSFLPRVTQPNFDTRIQHSEYRSDSDYFESLMDTFDVQPPISRQHISDGIDEFANVDRCRSTLPACCAISSYAQCCSNQTNDVIIARMRASQRSHSVRQHQPRLDFDRHFAAPGHNRNSVTEENMVCDPALYHGIRNNMSNALGMETTCVDRRTRYGTQAEKCKTMNCDRYGDVNLQGYCSVCISNRDPSYLRSFDLLSISCGQEVDTDSVSLFQGRTARGFPTSNSRRISSQSAVCKILTKHRDTGDAKDRARSARPPVTTPREDRFINTQASRNRRLTAKPVVVEEKIVVEPNMPKVKSVDEFCPDEGLDASFLDDVKESKASVVTSLQNEQESDSDDEAGNPMVAGFCEDLESDDEAVQQSAREPAATGKPANAKKQTISSRDVELTSDDDSDVDDVSAKSPIVAQNHDIDSDDLQGSSDKHTTKKKESVKTKSKSDSQIVENNKISKSDNNSSQSSDQTDTDANNTTQTKPTTELSLNGNISNPLTAKATSTSPANTVRKHDDDETPNSNSLEEGSDTESASQAIVVADVEDISDDDAVASRQHVKTPSNDHSDQDKEESKEEKKTYSLEFEDLSVLEKGFDFNTGMPKIDSGGDARTMTRSFTEPDSLSQDHAKKKKKKKDKERDKEDDTREKSHKKKKKHKERDREKTDENNSTNKDKSSKKKHSKQRAEQEELSELEKFLGPAIDTSGPQGGGYESYESL